MRVCYAPLPGDEDSEEDGAAEAHVVQRVGKPGHILHCTHTVNCTHTVHTLYSACKHIDAVSASLSLSNLLDKKLKI